MNKKNDFIAPTHMDGVLESLKNFNIERNELLSLIFESQHYQTHNLPLPTSISQELDRLTNSASIELISFSLPEPDGCLYYIRKNEASNQNGIIPVYKLNYKLAALEQVGTLDVKNKNLIFDILV